MGYKNIIDDFGSDLNEKEILTLADHYYDFATNTFNFLYNDMYGSFDNNINAVLEITSRDTNGVFGSCISGHISLHLYEILRVVPRNAIYTIIISVLAHELKHLNQNIPVNHNFNKKDTIKYIENPNDWETLQYLNEKREYIENSLGVNFNMLAYNHMDLSHALYKTDMYKPLTDKEYWVRLLCRLTFKRKDIKDIDKLFNDHLDGYQFINLTIISDVQTDRYYTFNHSIKINGNYTVPRDTLLNLIDNINTINRATFSLRVTPSVALEVGGLKNLVLDIVFKYSDIVCRPLIRYDDKPCAP